MAVHAPARMPAPADPARHQPVEVLIKEARQRASRRRRACAAGAAAVIACGVIAAGALDDADPGRGQASSQLAPGGTSPLGVFEPVRGRIVYPVGEQLHAVDPADPSSVRSLDLPVRVPHVVPAGWSADGTRLALTSEGELGSLVMDANGGITKVSGPGGCCAFVSDPWLSPDGTTAVDSTFGDRLRLRDLTSPDASRTVTLQSRVRGLGWGPKAWSPDGTRIAVTAQRRSTAPLSVEVVDLRTGAVRHLVPPAFGHVRQMAWSPDGSQLLVVAGPWQPTPGAHPMQNPLMSPHETGLYLVDTDPTAGPAPPDRIAFSYYVAATWSPDGTEIAAIDYYTLHSLIVMGADGSSPRVVVESMKSGWFTGLAWHPKPRP